MATTANDPGRGEKVLRELAPSGRWLPGDPAGAKRVPLQSVARCSHGTRQAASRPVAEQADHGDDGEFGA